MIIQGDCREVLKTLEPQSVQCVVTSPPYWGLRDYGVIGQLGLEETPEHYVDNIVALFGDVKRILRDDGTLWLNLGDSYAAGKQGRADGGYHGNGLFHGQRNHQATKPIQRKAPIGLKPKDLVGIPWRVAFALRTDGWYLRSDIIWHKPNPMPESVTDRPTKAHEYIFLLSKSAKYYYDADAIREPQLTRGEIHNGKSGYREGHPSKGGITQRSLHPLGRNNRSVWIIATHPYKEAHFATFPEELPKLCILAGSKLGDTILDPFLGSGTTGKVATELGRQFIGIELSPVYCELARRRVQTTMGML